MLSATALAAKLVECALVDKQGWAFQQIADRLEGKAAQQVDVNVVDNREIAEFSDAELTAMLKERVIHAPIDDKPRAEGETLNCPGRWPRACGAPHPA